MWHFVDLSNEQKHERRILLDRYAVIAQFSVLVPLLLPAFFSLVSRLLSPPSRTGDRGIPSSPYAKEVRSRRDLATSIQLWTDRAIWWAGEPIEVLGCYVSTRGEFMGAAIWTAWLLLLCMLDTGDDYLHLTKRFGSVAASQLPFHYLLAFKTPWSPLQLLTGLSWESLNRSHQLLGRICTVLIYLHAALYLNFYVVSGILAKKLQDKVVILGIIGTVAFTAIGTTALSWIRKANYRVFIALHVSLSTLLLPILYFHVHHIRLYIWETLALYLVHNILRYISTKTYTATICQLPGTSLLEINIPIPPSTTTFDPNRLLSRSLRPFTWHPSQHIYISRPSNPLSRTLSTNPFTITSLPSPTSSCKIRLIARPLLGPTKHLLSQTPSTSIPLTIEGPYGLTTHSLNLLHYNRVLFLAGGVGATFALPLYRTLLSDLSPGAGSRRRAGVQFVWCVKNPAETVWAFSDLDEGEGKGVRDRMRVFVTGRKEVGKVVLGDEGEDEGDGEDGAGAVKDEGQGEGEEVEMQRLLSDRGAVAAKSDQELDAGLEDLDVRYGRPDLRALVQETFAHGANESVAVVVCGPTGMAAQVRKEVGKYVRRGRDVWFWKEEFGL